MSESVLAANIIYTIQPASWRDLNALRQLEKICFPKDYWPLLDLIGILTFPNIVRLKAVSQDKMIGFIAGEKRMPENIGWISTVGVLPEYRQQGIGSALIESCERALATRRVRLNVRISNQTAARLYRQRGYQEISTWAAYYNDREDALVLEKQIPD